MNISFVEVIKIDVFLQEWFSVSAFRSDKDFPVASEKFSPLEKKLNLSINVIFWLYEELL